MTYRVVDTAPNFPLRARMYKNKGQALLYARNLKVHLPLGYEVQVYTFDADGYYQRVKTLNTIGSKTK